MPAVSGGSGLQNWGCVVNAERAVLRVLERAPGWETESWVGTRFVVYLG